MKIGPPSKYSSPSRLLVITVSRIFLAEVVAMAAENALRASEEKFRTLADWTYDWEYWVDQQGKIVYMSPSSENYTGFRPKEFVADPGLLLRVVHPADQQFVAEHQQLHHRELADTDNIEFRVIAGDGSERWIDHICRPLFGTDQRYLGRRVSNRDITRRKQAEQRLEIEQSKLRNIMDAMPDGIYIVNQQHDIEYVNPVIKREFGPVQGRKCFSYFHELTEACPWCKTDDVFKGKSVNWEWYSYKTKKAYDLFDTPIANLTS